jgi:hypothetical protein
VLTEVALEVEVGCDVDMPVLTTMSQSHTCIHICDGVGHGPFL